MRASPGRPSLPDVPEQPAPPVTIRDPSRPASVVEFGQAPATEPWRPSRTGLLIAGVAVLLVAGGTASLSRTAATQQHQAAERGLDAAATASVRLAVVDPAGEFTQDQNQVVVAVRNDSGRDLQVVRARVDDRGYEWQDVDLPLAPYAQGNLLLTSTPVCRPELAEHGPARLLLEVLTDRGTRTSTEVPLLDGEFGSPVTQVARQQCGTRPPTQSLDAQFVPQHQPSPTSVLLMASVMDNAVLPLTVTGVSGPPGFSASTPDRLPLALQPQQNQHDFSLDSGRPLHVLLAADCVYWRAQSSTDDLNASVEIRVARGRTSGPSKQYFDERTLAVIRSLVVRCRR